ncbi:uncharacterized protein Pyn_23420 [Prunus yedoensis var. nudiflora]|uniref:PHD and RING finger domain-containing protein 1 n=1 Tax=Prunus yedoensis var. nudiflora TaxID=2094558 RepID=A0A314UR25_PRUYE|nr:uncharacterized protein Pyn_23420 [Prunus yedoensis var. nudiflora]
MAGDTDMSSSSSPNKRLKTLKPEIQLGKDPIQDYPQEIENTSSSQSCAICYSNDEKAVRGEIDCCDHYFCFYCIMEWSKTESRCPLCRSRFTTIRRHRKAGVFARQRTFKVPLRDQVYHSHEHVVCDVCHLATDESLLLLCEMCDSAAHTYCVGLGHTLPDDDWFCQDCISTIENHVSSDSDDEEFIPTAVPSDLPSERGSNSQTTVINRYMMRFPQIVIPVVPDGCTSITVEVTTPARTLPRVSNRPNQSVASTLPSVADRPTESVANTLPSVAGRPTESVARTRPTVANRPTESIARTLDRHRNVHTRVQALRENWNSFQSGLLSFPSNSSTSGSSCSQKHNNGVLFHEKSGETQTSSSTSCQQLENRERCGSHDNDIDKAWKMMDIARSVQHAHEKCSSAVQFSKLPAGRSSDSIKRTHHSCFGISGQAQSSSSTGCQRPTNQVGCGSDDIDKAWKNVHTKTSSVVQHPKLLSREASASKEAMNVNSSVDILKSRQLGDWDRRRTEMEAYKCNSREKETIKHQSLKLEKERQFRGTAQEGVESSEGLSTSNSPGLFESQFSGNLNRAHCFSSSKLDVQRRNIGGAENCVESKVRKYDDAKSEIKSLVKINLKLLSKDKRLEVDAFKEIAWRSTHTILAACGLEHPKSGMPSFPSLVCCHTEQFHLQHKSNLMPESCRDCFYSFVKDVVSSIMAGSAKLSRGLS